MLTVSVDVLFTIVIIICNSMLSCVVIFVAFIDADRLSLIYVCLHNMLLIAREARKRM